MLIRVHLFLLAVLTTTLLSTPGCTILRREHGSTLPAGTVLVSGETHYRDVLHQSGPPTRLSKAGTGMAFLYEHTKVTERQLGINLEYEWLSLFKLALGRGHVKREAAVLLFDRDGLLRSHRVEQWKDSLGGGASIQFFISLISVVDTSEYNTKTDANDWGMQLLESRLPVQLNRAGGPDNPLAGLEQLATPTSAGQRTLELHQGP